MALCNHTTREVFFKFAMCGPDGSGKATSLNFIHQKIDAHFRGDIEPIVLDRSDKGIQLEILPVESTRIADYRIRIQLQTMIGPTLSDRSLVELLKGVDGLIFVADSTPDQQQANAESLRLTRHALKVNRLDPDLIPTVFQFNKRDILGAACPEEMDENLGLSQPSFLTCALSGHQVMATFDELLQSVLKSFHSQAVLRSRDTDGLVLSR